MSDIYPNIEMYLQGAVSGKFSEWPMLRDEVRDLLSRKMKLEAENAELREENKALSKHIDAIYKPDPEDT